MECGLTCYSRQLRPDYLMHSRSEASVWGKEVKTCQGEGCVLFALCPVECRYDDKPSIMRLVLVLTTQVLPQYGAHHHFLPPQLFQPHETNNSQDSD